MADLEAKFKEKSEFVRTWKPNKFVPTNEDKLLVYGLFKQATVGDVEGSQPWAVQVGPMHMCIDTCICIRRQRCRRISTSARYS